MQQIRLVVFAILMESRSGAAEKSPRDIIVADMHEVPNG